MASDMGTGPRTLYGAAMRSGALPDTVSPTCWKGSH
jgi:hypothetical protein